MDASTWEGARLRRRAIRAPFLADSHEMIPAVLLYLHLAPLDHRKEEFLKRQGYVMNLVTRSGFHPENEDCPCHC